MRQHSPHILPDGNILVFNNARNVEQIVADRVPGSNLIELDPATGVATIIYPDQESQSFYSNIMGAVEALPNDNKLVTESRAGRVFEITPDNEIVWEYVQPYDASHAATIEYATRYPPDYFADVDWACEQARK